MSMSPVKFAVSVLWPACWTGLPIKLGVALLLFAMSTIEMENTAGLALLLVLASPISVFAIPVLGALFDLHLSEGAGLAILFLVAIPIDMWAMGLTSRTVCLERLRVEPPDQLGLRLWATAAVAGGAYLVVLWAVERTVTDIAQSVSHSIVEIEMVKNLGVAERIGIELTLWGSVSTITLVLLAAVGLALLGYLMRRQVAQGRVLSTSYQGLVTRWDLMRVPGDQGLLLTAFTATGILLGVLFWASIPVTTPHPHESYKKPPVKVQPPFKPLESLNKTEKFLLQAETTVAALEQKKAEEETAAPKTKGGKNKGTKGAAASKAEAPAKP
jgi:hypothetical protein